MSGIAAEWIVFILFALLLVGVVMAEVFYLVRKGLATTGRAVGYVMVTDLLGFGIGSIIVSVVFFIMFMMVMGPAGRGSDIPEIAYAAMSLVGIIFPAIFLILSKRVFLSVFKIKSGKPAWIYSIVSSILIIVVVLVPPPLIYYLFAYLLPWK
jgi:hypothetical protein